MPYGEIFYIPKGRTNSNGQLRGDDGRQYQFRPQAVVNAPFDQELLGKRVAFSTGGSLEDGVMRVTVQD